MGRNSILKTRFLGYDGKNQFLVSNKNVIDFKNFDDIEKGFERQDSDSYEQWNQDEEP